MTAALRIALARPIIEVEEVEAVVRVLRSGRLSQGQEVAAFEDEFSAWVDSRTCVAVNSGTSALHLSLLGLGIGRGDEVILPAFSFAATANAVALTGAAPVFADIDLRSFCISADSVRSRIGPRTAALIPVHLYGHPATMQPLMQLASDKGLAVVEDAAQAHGATMHGRAVGTFGDAGCFSFYPTKNMTSGEGGMVVTADENLARMVRLLRNQGMDTKYQNEIVGYNNRMSELHAAIGRVQLKRLSHWNHLRRQNAQFLSANLRGVTVPTTMSEAVHVFHLYTVRSRDRTVLQARLSRAGVDSAVFYPTPIHRLPAFRRDDDLPETMRASREVLSLPIHPSLGRGELEQIVTAVNAS